MTYSKDIALKFIKNINVNKHVISLYEINEEDSNMSILGFKIPIGQVFLREYVTEMYRKSFIPWCFVQNSNNLMLSLESILYWKIYSGDKKLIAMEGDKILAVKFANNSDKIVNKRMENIENKPLSMTNTWLDMKNVPHLNIPLIEKEFFGKFHINKIIEVDYKTGQFKETKQLNYLRK